MDRRDAIPESDTQQRKVRYLPDDDLLSIFGFTFDCGTEHSSGPATYQLAEREIVECEILGRMRGEFKVEG